MDLDGWSCSKYCFYKGVYRIFVLSDATYRVCILKDGQHETIAEIIGLCNAVYHVEQLIEEKQNVPTL